MRRIQIFVALLIVLFLYLGLRLSEGLGEPAWFALGVICLGVLSFPMSGSRNGSSSRLRALWRWMVYLDMGLLSFLFSFTLIRDLFAVPLTWWRPDWHPFFFGALPSLGIVLASLLALAIGLWVAKSGPRVKSVRVPIHNLPDGLEGFRIAQISDLHVGPTIGMSYVEKVVGMVNALKPQLTVLTGDIVDAEIEHHRSSMQPLGQLQPAGQILYVTGNHEYYWDGPGWIYEFESIGIAVLQNTRRMVEYRSETILVAGVLDPAARLSDPGLGPDISATLRGAGPAAVKILLAHQPNIAGEAEKAGFDLLISGHTHAGQFFPFTIFIHRFQKFVKGLKALGRMWVYVNQGTGSWGPPIRLGTMTEITLLILTRAAPVSASAHSFK